MRRYSLYVTDSVSKRFLQSGASVEELKASKSTIHRWSNEMGYPPPEKGAILSIECDEIVSEARYGATRLRWYDKDSAPTQPQATMPTVLKSAIGRDLQPKLGC